MKYLFLFFSLLPQLLWAQYHFNFEPDTGGVTETGLNDHWEQVPAGRWECTMEGAISGDYSLHHSFDNPDAGCDYVIIPHDPIQDTDSLSFSFRVKHGHPPSSANNWQVAFVADCSEGIDLANGSERVSCTITRGLILGVNFRDSDDLVKLWKCQNGNCLELCTTSLNYQDQVGTDVAPEFRLVWYREGGLDIYFTRDPEQYPVEQIGSCMLDSLPGGRNLVIRYEYSPARDRNLWMDEIKMDGNFVRDTVAPGIEGVKVLDARRLQINFSEPVHLFSHHSFHLSGTSYGSMNPDTIHANQGELVLEFPGIIPNREEQLLWVTGICDGDANCLSDTLVTILRNEAEWGDVVFNELMVDPTPSVLLSEEEYLEVYNRSGYEVNLGEWKLEVNSKNHLITEQIIEPATYGVIAGITLPNEGATLALYSETGKLVHSVRYSLPWEGPDWKKEGGWSLESPDPDLVCNISEFWEYSSDPRGGTPGRINSNDAVLEDSDHPLFLYAGYGDQPGLVCLHFTEPVRFTLQDLDHVFVNPGHVKPDSVTTNVPLSDQMLLWFSEDMRERSAFRLLLPAVADCSGNPSGSLNFQFGRTADMRFGSMLINEMMYDPLDGKPEYIELYNPGDDFFDLRELSLNVLKEGTEPVSPIPLSDHSRLVSPGEYLVVTRSIPHLMEAYHLELTGRWIEVKSMAVMQNPGGTVMLTDRSGAMVDMAFYGDHLHMELLNETRGVSLERISAVRPGIEADNWHSAASVVDYATPGRENSQSVNDRESTELLTVDPEVFSPDNDGFQDLLKISISPGTQGWVIRMWITDLNGDMIRNLANNHLSGPSVSYTWDGVQESGRMASGGIYVLHVLVHHPVTGERWSRKKAFGLVYR